MTVSCQPVSKSRASPKGRESLGGTYMMHGSIRCYGNVYEDAPPGSYHMIVVMFSSQHFLSAYCRSCRYDMCRLECNAYICGGIAVPCSDCDLTLCDLSESFRHLSYPCILLGATWTTNARLFVYVCVGHLSAVLTTSCHFLLQKVCSVIVLSHELPAVSHRLR